MPSRRPRPRRFLIPLLLAAVLVGEVTGLALARSLTPTPAGSAAPAAPAVVAAPPSVPDADASGTEVRPAAALVDASRDAVAVSANAARVRKSVATGRPATQPASPVRSTTSTKTAPTTPKSRPTTTTKTTTSSPSYQGRNRVWIPALGMNRAVSPFPCSRTRPPDNLMYRWGCAGRNNVYLMGHAHSVMKPLHDAYVSGRLKKGMKVIYADGAGRVHTYSVIWWRVVKPTTAASWAWAAQSRPSMTLQTCVGARSESRLMVRLVQVG